MISNTTSDLNSVTDTDARRLALEAIATLANSKKICADQVLRRAAVPEPLILRFLTERDPTTNERRSKRDAGTMVLDELAQEGTDRLVIRNIVKLAAEWSDFHLAQDEYKARAVVQKALGLQGTLQDSDKRANALEEQRREAGVRNRRREQKEAFDHQSRLLLAQFDSAAASTDFQNRGYLLEDLLNRTFSLHSIAVHRSFRRNDGGEQIDAAFELEGWHYLVECRWRARLADIRQLDGLSGQVSRSGKQTMGLFLSIEGWSDNVVPLLKQNPDKSIFMMEGFDLRSVLEQRVELRRLLKAKIAALNLEAEPFLSVVSLDR